MSTGTLTPPPPPAQPPPAATGANPQDRRNNGRGSAVAINRGRDVEDTRGGRRPITTADVIGRMSHPPAIHIADRRAAADYLLERVSPGDVILTLGAGDGDMVGRWLLEALEQQRGVASGY